MPLEERPELAHLVPEDREVPVVDLEVVVLDVGEDRWGGGEALVEASAQSVRDQRAVLLGDPLPLRKHRLGGACDVLAGAEPRDVGADRPDLEAGVVDPRAMWV